MQTQAIAPPRMGGAAVEHYKPGADAFLTEYDSYIHMQARKYILGAGGFVHPDVREMEIDELAQKIRIKIWQAWQKQTINNPKAYIKRAVHNEFVSMVRNHRSISQLPLDEEGELYQGHMVCMFGQESQDPADEVEQEDTYEYYLHQAVDEIITLPRRQRRAMFCTLKEKIDDVLALGRACLAHNIDVEGLPVPTSMSTGELQAMRASTTIARKKLRPRLKLQKGVQRKSLSIDIPMTR